MHKHSTCFQSNYGLKSSRFSIIHYYRIIVNFQMVLLSKDPCNISLLLPPRVTTNELVCALVMATIYNSTRVGSIVYGVEL